MTIQLKSQLTKKLTQLIKDHTENAFCTSYEEATETLMTDVEGATNQFYDVGRYDTLKEVLQIVQKMEA